MTKQASGGHFLSTVAELGVAMLGMGNLDVPAQLSIRLGASYPMSFGGVGVAPGLLINYTPIKFEDRATGTASLTSVLLNVTGTYAVTDQITGRAELGFGVLIFGGLIEGNPFTEGGASTTGALSMPNVRFALGVDYQINDSLAASVTPIAFASSKPKEGLNEAIDTITRFDVLVGIGYRL